MVLLPATFDMCSWQSNNGTWLWGELLGPPGAVHEVEEIDKLLFTYIGMLQKVGAKEWILEAGICFILSSGGNGLFMFVCKVAFLVLQRVLNTIPETKELRVFFHKIAFWRGRDAALASDPIQVHAGSAALLISY